MESPDNTGGDYSQDESLESSDSDSSDAICSNLPGHVLIGTTQGKKRKLNQTDIDHSEEIETIKRYVPEVMTNQEIEAYLDVDCTNPNRVKTTVKEILETIVMPKENKDKLMKRLNEDIPDKLDTRGIKLLKCLNEIEIILPGIDKEEITDFVNDNLNNTLILNSTVLEWFINQNYPRRKKNEIEKRIISGIMNVEEFLKLFPNPQKTFIQDRRAVNENYRRLAVYHTFKNYGHIFLAQPLNRLLTKHNYQLIPVTHAIQNMAPAAQRKTKSHVQRIEPACKCIQFYRDKLYLKLEQEISNYLKDKQIERTKKLKDRKEKNVLLSCECCYDDELLIEDVYSCVSFKHFFCHNCIRQYAEDLIARGKYRFPCLGADCSSNFPLTVLENCLLPDTFANASRQIQKEEFGQVCPFCSENKVMPDPNLPLLKCLNEGCLKVFCRLCKKESHMPFPCKGIHLQAAAKQKQEEMKMLREQHQQEIQILKDQHQKEMEIFKEQIQQNKEQMEKLSEAVKTVTENQQKQGINDEQKDDSYCSIS